MDESTTCRAVLSGVRDSLNRQGRLFGHPALADFAAMRSVIRVLRGDAAEDLSPEDVRIILETDYLFHSLRDEDAAMVAELKEVRSISLMGSPLGPGGMKSLASLARLTSLDVGNAGLKRSAYAGIGGMRGLVRFGISGDKKFGDADIDVLSGLGGLEVVKLRETGLTDAGISKLSAILSLVEIEMPSGVTDAGLASIASLPRLTSIWLGSKTTDEGLARLASQGRLERVKVNAAGITDVSMRALAACRRLRTLDVNRCSKVTDEGVIALAACDGIEELNLSGTKVTGSGLRGLSGLAGIRTLHLQKQKLTDLDVPALAAMRSLSRVMLGGTQLTGAGFAALRKALPECDINTLG